MNLLDTIKDQVARGISKSYADWKDYISDDPFGASDYAVNQVARRYATEVARHNLERAANQAKVQYFVVGEKADVGELTARVDKESILKLEIELI